MNIKSKLLAHKVITGLMALVLTVGLVGLAVAFSSEKAPQNVFENVGSVNIAAPIELPVGEPTEDTEDEVFGAVTSPYLPGPDFAVGGDLQFSLTGDFKDATSTLVSVYSPFLRATTTASDKVVLTDGRVGWTVATSTVELVRLNVTTAATTTIEIDCSASDTTYTTTSASIIINTEDKISTSSKFYIESGMTSSTDNNFGSLVLLNNEPVYKIQLTPLKPYLVCRAWQPYGTTLSSLTDPANVFAGKYVVRVSMPRL